MSIDQQFVEFVIKSLVSKPDKVKVERRIDEKGVLLELTVDPEDLGRVIGKRGATAQSVRTLLRALGTKNDARYNLKIVDNGPNPSRGSDDGGSRSGGGLWGDDKESPVSEEAKEVIKEATEDIAEEPKEENKEDAFSRTRKELADLDDLDL
ncbi:KH domain-containing protein [Candidatus Saccharibacteria bacterium]|nr:KH domain-containing protein [Candidatus Saccharibacteria bacterium]